MKKIFTFLLLSSMLILIVGCSSEKTSTSNKHEEHEMQIWYNANCQAPKTCGVCGYTEGELGEHSVKVGTCHHCNEFQNKDLFETIKTDLTELSIDLKSANDFLSEKANDQSSDELIYAAAIETISPTFEAEKSKLENVLKMCGEYNELSDIKRQVETALKYFPIKPNGTNIQESKEYFTNAKMSYTYILEALNQTQFVA